MTPEQKQQLNSRFDTIIEEMGRLKNKNVGCTKAAQAKNQAMILELGGRACFIANTVHTFEGPDFLKGKRLERDYIAEWFPDLRDALPGTD